MEWFPPDRYGVRMVLTNVVMLPCAVIALIAFYPHFKQREVYWVTSLTIGFGAAFVVGWFLHLAGLAAFRLLDRVLSGKRSD